MLSKRPSLVIQFLAIISAFAGMWYGALTGLWNIIWIILISISLFIISAIWHRNIMEE